MSEPYWVPLSGAPAPGVRRIPIDLLSAQQVTNPGNAFPMIAALTAWEAWHWEFLKDVDGAIFGRVYVPAAISVTIPPKIVLTLGANATAGVTRLSASYAAVPDGASLNPASLTAITAQDITVPATARLRKDVTFTLATQPAAGDLLLVKLTHEGAHANDTLAANTELYGAWFEAAMA